MIPLVLLDIDGVLIGSSGHVLDCVWQSIDKVRAAGVKLAVCTGRPCAGVAQRVAKRLGPNNPHIFQSGALISYPSGEALQTFALKKAALHKLVDYAREHAMVLELYTPNAVFVERKTPLSEAHVKMIGVSAIVRDLAEVARNEPVVRAQWVLTREQFGLAMALELEGVTLSPATSPALKDAHFVSITQAGVSKGSGVLHLARALGVAQENIMAVGDSIGDLSMLEAVGHPVVMENAPDELRRRFAVAGHVESCGVVAALEEALRLKAVRKTL
jgi:Cof subfamily protein (haloacid dehalogenase superfamily)